MKNFYIYKHPIYGADAVKVGFSWPALCFGPVWLVAETLWGHFAWWLAAQIAVLVSAAAVVQWFPETQPALVYALTAVATLGLWTVPAFRGNRWKARSLIRRGYQTYGDLYASTPDTAVALSGMSPRLYRELNRPPAGLSSGFGETLPRPSQL